MRVVTDLSIEMILIALGVILVTHFIGAIAAFGSSTMAVPLLVMLCGPESLPMVVFVLIVIGTSQALFITCLNWRKVDAKSCALLLLGSAFGIPVGMMSVDSLPEKGIMLLLGGLTLFAGLTGGLSKHKDAERGGRRWAVPVSALSGVIHGAFGTGGTILAAYAQRILPDRDEFRATLSLYWSLLNIGFLTALIFRVKPGVYEWGATLLTAVLVLAVTLTADRLAGRIHRELFQRGVSLLLVVSGIVILVGQM